MNTDQLLQFSSTEYWADVEAAMKRGHEIVDRMEEMANGQIYAGNAEQALAWYDEEHDILERELGWVLRRLRMRLILGANVLGADSFLQAFNTEWSAFDRATALEHLPWIGVLHCPALDFMREAFDMLAAFLPSNTRSQLTDDSGHALLERILEGTGKILEDRGLVPDRESEVRNAIYCTLLHVFPDTVREVPIAQVSKVYKPDIGVRRLKTAVEYKFATTAEELRSQMGGIYEDIKGYAGSADWTHFIAVFYATGHWLTRHQIEAEWSLVNVPSSWKPILVVAPARSKPKKRGGASV